VLLLQIPQYLSSSLLALLGTQRKYSVRKLIGALSRALLARNKPGADSGNAGFDALRLAKRFDHGAMTPI